MARYDIIVLPYAAAKRLTPERQHVLLAACGGRRLLTDGASEMSRALGVTLENESLEIYRLRDRQFPDETLFWEKPLKARPVSMPADGRMRALCVEQETRSPIVVEGAYGKGKFIFFSAVLPRHGEGYSRFPFLIEMLESVFGYVRPAERKTMAVYFDPGNRNFMEPEKLAALWRKEGVHSVYAGGWYFLDDYTYDYGRLIRACHEKAWRSTAGLSRPW